MGVTFRIEYLASVVAEDIPALPKAARRKIKKAIEERLGSHPLEFGKPLRYSLKGARRLRVGDYRIIYKVESPTLVLIVKISHRKDVYEG